MSDATLDFTGLEAQVNDTSTEVQQTESTEPIQAEPDVQTQADPAVAQTDGRRGPANIRAAIKAASEAMPEQAAHFKELGNAYFREQAFKQHFPTPQEAASAKQLIEGVGGLDGITQIQSRIAGYDAQDEGLKNGSPETIDALFKDFPEGAVALAPHYLVKLQATNPTAFSAAIAPHAVAMLDAAGVGGHLDALLNEADPARSKQMIKQLADWFAGQKSNIAQIKQAPVKNPQADRVAEERKALDTEKESLFSERMAEKVNSSTGPEIKKVVDSYAKQHKWSPDQAVEFQNKLQKAIVDQMNADNTYKQQVALRKQNKARTPDTVASYISGEFNRRMNDKDGAMAVATAFNKFLGKTPGAATTGLVKAGQPQAAPGGGPLLVSQRPQDSEFADYPGLSMDIIQGRAKLKNGRFVTWRKSN